MSQLFLTFTSEADALIAEDKINENMGYPKISVNTQGVENPEAQITLKWNGLKKAHNLDLWYLAKPPKEEDLIGVENYVIQEYDFNWAVPPLV